MFVLNFITLKAQKDSLFNFQSIDNQLITRKMTDEEFNQALSEIFWKLPLHLEKGEFIKFLKSQEYIKKPKTPLPGLTWEAVFYENFYFKDNPKHYFLFIIKDIPDGLVFRMLANSNASKTWLENQQTSLANKFESYFPQKQQSKNEGEVSVVFLKKSKEMQEYLEITYIIMDKDEETSNESGALEIVYVKARLSDK
jgi:hypothetical protein